MAASGKLPAIVNWGRLTAPPGDNLGALLPYSLLRRALFLLEPERSHHLSLEALKWGEQLHLGCLYRKKTADYPVTAMGLTFPNPIGLAAGLDKNGDYIDALGDLGFGFVEIGTVTPRPQPGNPQPRLFRLPEQEAIINRMGFNNKGVDYLVRQVGKRRYKGILGINIGKNADTPVEQAGRDYLTCLERVYAYADYVAVNLSSPNTPGLRSLQQGDAMKKLISELADSRALLSARHRKHVPMLVKVAPDMSDEDIHRIAEVALEYRMDGLIATNTTISRDRVKDSVHAQEAGGLSGKPVFDVSTHVLQELKKNLGGKLCLIGVGGIDSAQTAQAKLAAGADLIQIYTGFIYRGPALLNQIRATW
jgi:dihydroorotate dehydrogenase